MASTMLEPVRDAPLIGHGVVVSRPLTSSGSLSPPASSPSICCESEIKMKDSATGISVEELCGVLEHATLDDDWEDSDSDKSGSSILFDEEKDMSMSDSEKLLVASLLHTPSRSPSRHSLQPDNNNDNGNSQKSGTDKSLEDLHDSYASLASSASSSSTSLALEDNRLPTSHSQIQDTPRRPSSAPPCSLLEAALRRGDVAGDDIIATAPYYYYDGNSDYAGLVQPAFPQVFDIFDYGDGFCYYLGGGGHRITRHLSRRQRRSGGRRMGSGAGGSGIDNFWPFENPPLYACRLHHASTGLPPVVLYGGTDADKDGAWADVQFGAFSSFGPFSSGITVGLPPVANQRTAWLPLSDTDDSSSSSSSSSADSRTEEKMSVHFGWHKRYRFEVEVETQAMGGGVRKTGLAHREVFEWRYCSGAELEALLDEPGLSGGRKADGAANREDDDDGQQQQPQRAGLGNKAGRLLKRTWTLRRGCGGRGGRGGSATMATIKDGEPSNEKMLLPPKKKQTPPRWRGGWQLVRLADARDPLAEAIQATAAAMTTDRNTDTNTNTTTSTPRVSSTASTLLLDQLIGEEAGRAAERRRTSDGREIVATWANAEMTTASNLDGASDYYHPLPSSANVTARFSFLGSGKSGQLGERWALMAVASGLAVWERERRARRRRQSTVVQACGGLANIGA